MMKKLKSFIATIFALGVITSTFGVNAGIIVDADRMRNEVEATVLSSPFVRTKRRGSKERERAIVDVCERRIRSLGSMLIKGKLDRDEIEGVIRNYVGFSGIGESYEAGQLLRTETYKELRCNVELLVGVYTAIKSKHSPSLAPTKSASGSKRTPVHHLDKCPGRKGEYRRGGRFGRI